MTGQTDFTAAILDPELATPEGLIDPKGRPAGKRFDVYRNNVVSSLLDAMETAFPVIQKLVGAEFFRSMSGIYIRQFPPQSPMLMFYGEEFPTFLDSFEPVSHLPYLPDVARLELSRRRVYHAGDPQGFDPAEFSQIDPDRMDTLKIELVPALELLSSPYPVHSIWHYNMVDGDLKIPAHGENIAVIRPQLDVDAVVLPDADFAFISALKAGSELAEAAETATELDQGFDLSKALGVMIGTNMINRLAV